MIVSLMHHQRYRTDSEISYNGKKENLYSYRNELSILFSCANGESLKQLAADPFLVHTNEAQANFDRLISDSESKI